MKHLLREPLVHFLLIGAVLFGIYSLTQSGRPATASSKEIRLSLDEIAKRRMGRGFCRCDWTVFPGPLFRGGQTVALAIHLQNVNMMGQPVQQRTGQASGTKDTRPFIERQIAGDHRCAVLVAPADHLEQQFRTDCCDGDVPARSPCKHHQDVEGRNATILSSD